MLGTGHTTAAASPEGERPCRRRRWPAPGIGCEAGVPPQAEGGVEQASEEGCDASPTAGACSRQVVTRQSASQPVSPTVQSPGG